MTRPELLKLLREICGEILEKDCSHVRERDELTSVGLDSMGSVELVDTAEKRLRILIPNNLLIGVRSIGQLLDIVETCDGNRAYWTPARLAAKS